MTKRRGIISDDTKKNIINKEIKNGDDAKMKNLILIILLVVVCSPICYAEPPAVGKIEKERKTEKVGIVHGSIEGYCQKQWANDYSMQEYCIKKQKKSIRDFIKIYDKYFDKYQQPIPEYENEASILINAISKWEEVKDGKIYSNWTMILYETKKQLGAYYRLKNK